MNIFISEASHPIKATTNSPKKVKDNSIIKFDFGSWKHQIIEVSVTAYFEAGLVGNEYALGKAQHTKRTDSFNDFYVANKYEKAGRRHVRVDMSITLPVGKKFIQLLFPTNVLDDINTVVVQAKCISLCSLDFSYEISRLNTRNITVIFPYKANVEFDAKSDSILTDWMWSWQNTIFSRKESVNFILSEYMDMKVTVSNSLSTLGFYLVIQYNISIEDVMVLVRNPVNQKEMTNLTVLFTSFDDLTKIQKSQTSNVTLQITNRRPGSLSSEISLQAENEACYENTRNPLKQFLSAWGRPSPENFQGVEGYCFRTIQTSFRDAGPHDAVAKITHQVRCCFFFSLSKVLPVT